MISLYTINITTVYTILHNNDNNNKPKTDERFRIETGGGSTPLETGKFSEKKQSCFLILISLQIELPDIHLHFLRHLEITTRSFVPVDGLQIIFFGQRIIVHVIIAYMEKG